MSKKKISGDEPTPLCLKDVKFFATHYLYQHHGKEELSVSLIQRRYLIGYMLAVQVYSYIRGALELGQAISKISAPQNYANGKLMELRLTTFESFAKLLEIHKLSSNQTVVYLDAHSVVTATVQESPSLDLWLLANSDSIQAFEKSQHR